MFVCAQFPNFGEIKFLGATQPENFPPHYEAGRRNTNRFSTEQIPEQGVS
jgi:hypothetical protein